MKNNKTVAEIAEGILAFLRKRNMTEAIPELIDYLRSADSQNSAYIYSARELTADEKKQAVTFFNELTGESPDIVFETDNTLIDGMKIAYRDKMWDLSVKAQIDKLAKA